MAKKENTANINTKTAIRSSGGGTTHLAIAMLEDKRLEATYPFGDKLPDGTPKTGDAANFGVYKMNWYMIKQCPSARPLIGSPAIASAWQVAGKRINSDPGLATKLLSEAMVLWSTAAPNPSAPTGGNFWAGHRWGESGLKNLPTTDWLDIQTYYHAVLQIKAACDADPNVWTSKVRYYVKVKNV